MPLSTKYRADPMLRIHIYVRRIAKIFGAAIGFVFICSCGDGYYSIHKEKLPSGIRLDYQLCRHYDVSVPLRVTLVDPIGVTHVSKTIHCVYPPFDNYDSLGIITTNLNQLIIIKSKKHPNVVHFIFDLDSRFMYPRLNSSSVKTDYNTASKLLERNFAVESGSMRLTLR